MYATLDIAINTDMENSPVIATIINGPLKGGKVIGKTNIVNKLLKVDFNKIHFGGRTDTSFAGVAVDADTAESYVNGHRDTHFIKRYGTLFATSFLEGIGDVVLEDIQAKRDARITNIDSDGNTTETAAVTTTNWGDRAIASLSTVGAKLNAVAIAEYEKIPEVTITVPSGQMIGIMLTADYEDQRS